MAKSANTSLTNLRDYDAYLLDWDGTLAQTFEAWLAVVQDVLKSYNIKATTKTIILQIFGRPRQGFAELGVPNADIPAVLEAMVETAQTRLPQSPLYPDVRELLEVLHKRGKHLAIITASARSVIDRALAHHQLQQFFDVVISGSELKHHKPDPEGLLRALTQMGMAPNRAVMLGDSEKDILAAHNAGIDSLLFFPPEHHAYHTLEHLTAHQPTYVITAWQELLDQLQLRA